ncbi:MAG: hypothetical protein HQK97_07300 [Nitrospirae bacterium]|nr:hypothetical protein [Nitrospirota bacterium]
MLLRAEKLLIAVALIVLSVSVPVNAFEVPLNSVAHVYFSPVGGGNVGYIG